MQSPCFSASRGPFLSIGCQRRNSAIWRIHNQRSPKGGDNSGSSIPPEVVISHCQVRRSIGIATLSVVPLAHLLLESSGFIGSKEWLSREFRRAFQRREGCIGPDALQVRWIVV